MDGGLHSRELTGSQVALSWMAYPLNHYGEDPRVTELLDTRTFYIHPKFNADGSDLVMAGNVFLQSTPRPVDEPAGKEGLREVAQELLLEAGAGEMTAEARRARMDGLGISSSVSVEEHRLRFDYLAPSAAGEELVELALSAPDAPSGRLVTAERESAQGVVKMGYPGFRGMPDLSGVDDVRREGLTREEFERAKVAYLEGHGPSVYRVPDPSPRGPAACRAGTPGAL